MQIIFYIEFKFWIKNLKIKYCKDHLSNNETKDRNYDTGKFSTL